MSTNLGNGDGRIGAVGKGTAEAVTKLGKTTDVTNLTSVNGGATIKAGTGVRNDTTLEGVDRVALAMICNATGLAVSDPTCKQARLLLLVGLCLTVSLMKRTSRV